MPELDTSTIPTMSMFHHGCRVGREKNSLVMLSPAPLGDNMKSINYHSMTALTPVIESGSNQTLSLKGVLLDVISFMTPAYIYPVDTRQKTAAVLDITKVKHHWHEEAYHLATEKSHDPYLNDQPRDEAFWRTLIGNRSLHEPAPALSSFADYYTMWAIHMARGAIATDFAALQEQRHSDLTQGNPDYKYFSDPRF